MDCVDFVVAFTGVFDTCSFDWSCPLIRLTGGFDWSGVRERLREFFDNFDNPRGGKEAALISKKLDATVSLI